MYRRKPIVFAISFYFGLVSLFFIVAVSNSEIISSIGVPAAFIPIITLAPLVLISTAIAFMYAEADMVPTTASTTIRIVYMVLPIFVCYLTLLIGVQEAEKHSPHAFFASVPPEEVKAAFQITFFFFDQILAVVCFDFFDIFDWRLSEIDVTERFEAKVFEFCLRLFISFIALGILRQILRIQKT